MTKQVAVIILNYNTPDYTTNCVKSIIRYCDTIIYDIIIADNGSTDSSLKILQSQFPELFFIDNKENLGFAEGNNRAMQYSIDRGYKYTLLINSDTEADSDFIAILKTHLDLNEHVAAVQPAIYWLHKRDKLWNSAGYFNKVTGNTVSKTSIRYQLINKPLEVEWVTGCCALFRNQALKKTGLFNANFFLYFEDVDLSFRLRRNNFKLHYLATTKIFHEAGVSGKKNGKEGFLNPLTHYYTSRNHLWIIRRYLPAILLVTSLTCNFFYYGILWLYFKIRKKNQKASLLLKGLKDGLFTKQLVIWPGY